MTAIRFLMPTTGARAVALRDLLEMLVAMDLTIAMPHNLSVVSSPRWRIGIDSVMGRDADDGRDG